MTATKSLDDKAIAQWLKTNRVDTIQGKLRFDGPSNYGDDLMRVKQVQNGRWVTVWPKALKEICEKRNIRVIAPDVGGGFGSKLQVYAEELLVGYLSKTLGRPVKWSEERSENFQATIHGRGQVGEVEVAVDRLLERKPRSVEREVLLEIGIALSESDAEAHEREGWPLRQRRSYHRRDDDGPVWAPGGCQLVAGRPARRGHLGDTGP